MRDIVVVAANVTPKVTALLGMVNRQGLPEHDIPVWVDQLPKTQPDDAVAVTVIGVPAFSEQPDGLGQLGETVPVPESTRVIRMKVSWVNVTDTVTELLGMMNWQGLVVDPLEQDAPVTVQLVNCQPDEGVAVTETDKPTACWHETGLGQLGETDP